MTLRGLAWALTTDAAANWHPVTWASHLLDVRLFGLDAGRHHRTNLLLHVASTLLLFLLLRACTGRPWRSALAAALFAVHPLHVESVAWVAERKDLLAGLFWMLVGLAYLRFAKRPGAATYLPVPALYALGLMAKPMLVTLPLVLLLLDYWPLGRLGHSGRPRAGLRPFLEKAPLFLLAAASAVVTFRVQARGAAVTSLDAVPLGRRLAQAAISCAAYLWKTLAPTDLSFLYLYPRGPLPAGEVIAAAGFVALAATLALWARRRRPWLCVGWFWYLITLVPVLGIVQVGVQARADRYTYLPLVGIFLMVAWSLPPGRDVPRRGRMTATATATAALALALVGVLAVAARAQLGTWRDDLALFGHAARVDPDNWVAQNNLGKALALQGRVAEAAPHFAEAVRANPAYAAAWHNLGVARLREGKVAEAAAHLRKAVAVDPDYFDARISLGSSLVRQGMPREALEQFEEARRLRPGDPVPLYNLGAAWSALGELSRAEEHYRSALRLQPEYAPAVTGLEIVRRQRGLQR